MSEYDTDILAWSEHQGELLRRLAGGETVNDQVDWENVIEEIESVGRFLLNTVRSSLLQALYCKLKIQAWPHARDVRCWRMEIDRHWADAITGYEPAMRQRIDLAEIYAKALHIVMSHKLDDQDPLPVPQECPYTLDELLVEGRL